VNAYELIRRKREGASLEEAELRFLVGGYVRGEVRDYQMAAFLMAAAIKGMTLRETVDLTRVMMESGRVLEFHGSGGPVIDKHSTGGVGDKISIPLVPVAVECGLRVPMISGRSLGATGGTLDKIEAIPGMTTGLTPERLVRQVNEVGGCFGAQTETIVPADRSLYALRDATATVESVPLIVSSILSKKFAEGIGGVVIDVKCGVGAFMRTLAEARELASALEGAGGAMDIPVKTIVTAMDQPLGLAIGNALEVEEAIRFLEGGGPSDVAELTLRLAAEMLLLAGLVPDIDTGETLAKDAVSSGRALERFGRIVSAQGGRLASESAAHGLPRAKLVRPFLAQSGGFVSRLDARIIGEAVRELGGGRFRTDDVIDPAAGIVLLKKRGDEVVRGEPILEVHASSEERALAAARNLEEAVRIAAGPIPRAPLFLEAA
jgi:pyrimidine-nucleoside phosphorylase